MALLLAFSIEDQVEKYGAYVGIAAFFGLAVLSMLYFAQAREVKRLREWAGRAPERAREVEERAIAQAEAARRQPPVQQPAAVAQPVAAATAAGGRSGTVSPAVPVAGTATAVAERPDEDEEEEEPIVHGPVTEDGKKPVLADRAAREGRGRRGGGRRPTSPTPTRRSRAARARRTRRTRTRSDGRAAPATNGAPPAGAQPPAIPRPSTAAGVAGAVPKPPAEQTRAPAPAPLPPRRRRGPRHARPCRARPPLRSARPRPRPRRAGRSRCRRGGPDRPRRPPPAGGHRRRSFAIAGGVAAVFVALAVLAATQFLGGDDTTPPPNETAQPTAAPTDEAGGGGGGGDNSSSSSTSRADTTVAVFNGTTINGLAASTADKIQSSGYKRGTTGDFTDQQRAASTVFYAKDARRQAREIGRELNISELRVMDAETQALAGENADIAVVVGSDKAP